MGKNRFLVIFLVFLFIITLSGCENDSKKEFSDILSANTSYFEDTEENDAVKEKESQKDNTNAEESSSKNEKEDEKEDSVKSEKEESSAKNEKESQKVVSDNKNSQSKGSKKDSSVKSSKEDKKESSDKSGKEEGSSKKESSQKVSEEETSGEDQSEASSSNTEKEETDDEDKLDIAIPIIYIQTENNVAIPETKEKVRCAVTLEEGDDYFATDLSASVNYRGNGSLNVAKEFGKYPYKLKFDNKEKPFGLGNEANRDWILIPNRGDRTMLRNFAAKKLGEKLSGITYSSRFMAVHVFVNGRYEGVYELSEQIEAAKGRVPVDDGQNGNENGFLVELDKYAKNAEEGDITFTIGKNYYSVKSKIKNDAQLEYTKEYINKIEQAVYSGDEKAFCDLVDINSAVDMYLLQEFSKNIDGGFSSFYMYKNVGERLYFSPPWDFDLAFGNDRRLDNGSPKGLYIAEGRENFTQNHLWYIELCKNEWFTNKVKARWKEISNNEIISLISEVEKMAEFLSYDMAANFRRWPEFSQKLHHEPEHTLKFKTYKEHTDYLVNWMKDRKDFLDSVYNG